MYGIRTTGQYKKDVKACAKRNYDLSLLSDALEILQETGTLPFYPYKTHKLTGQKVDVWDAHIKPDWLLLWRMEESEDVEYDGIIHLLRTGTHSELFGKGKLFNFNLSKNP